jgi:hypothetical protein
LSMMQKKQNIKMMRKFSEIQKKFYLENNY